MARLLAAAALPAGLLATAAGLQQELGGGLQQELGGGLQQETGSSSAFWNMFGALPDNAPDWCRSEAALSWEEKRRRVEQRATLQWARQQVQELLEKNETIPKWMDDMVARSTKQGQMKWAAKEAKRLKHEKKDVPEWMAALEEEDDKWANRWAACKVSELQFAGADPPDWMRENGRKAVYAAAMEKLAEIQEQIDELEALKEKQVALVQARGDIKLAERRQLVSHRPTAATPRAPSKVEATNSTKALPVSSRSHVSSNSNKVLDLSKKKRDVMSMISQAAVDVEGDDRRVA